MSKYYSSYIYNHNTGYAIGDIDSSDNYVNGLGYVYWAETQDFAMGKFSHQNRNGWVCANGDNGGHHDRIYFSKWKSGEMCEGVSLMSDKELLSIVQTNSNGKYEGYKFLVWPDGSWTYRYQDESNDSRAVFYNGKTKQFGMGYLENGEWTWSKYLQKLNWSVPFGVFGQAIYDDPGEFEESENSINPTNDGPSMDWNEENECTIIGPIVNGKWDGVVLRDWDESTMITQYDSGDSFGPEFWINKKTYAYKYSFFDGDDDEHPVRVYGWDDGDIEIRNYKNKKTYDAICIDKDFNIRYLETAVEGSDEIENEIDYDYEDVYNGKYESEEAEEVEEEEEKPRVRVKPKAKPKAKVGAAKPVKKPVGKKKPKASSSDDWTMDFKQVFGKKKKK